MLGIAFVANPGVIYLRGFHHTLCIWCKIRNEMFFSELMIFLREEIGVEGVGVGLEHPEGV